jgi:hypothetical protein
MKVWTCDVCHVVQFPTFEEAVEHEKICTGIPPSSWPQTKAALLEHEKSEKEPSSSVITSEPSNQSLGGVNQYDTYPMPQPQHLSSTALNAAVAAANEVVGDTGVRDVIEQEPIMEVPVAAMTSKPRQVTDTVGVRESYSSVMTGVIGVPLGVEAATTAASSGCPEHMEPHPCIFLSTDNGKETVQNSSPHNTTAMNGSDDDNEDMVKKMALEL